MGLNYSFNLYYALDLIETVLQQLPSIANCDCDKLTEIELPNGRYISIPFTSNFEAKRLKLSSGQECVELDTSLIFPVDEPIRKYVLAYDDTPPEIGSLTKIGYIYLHVSVGIRFGEISFMAATSSMSRLFLDSRSIQDTFINFMRLTEGLFGYIDVEDYYYLAITDPSQRIDIETSDIEIDFYPYYDIDLFVDRYFSQIDRK